MGPVKKILICAGIHGDEPQSNLATIKLIDFLRGKGINGTIYIIPFAMPCDTAKNSRYYEGTDPNRQAMRQGSPVNKILNFALSNDIDYLIDVHAGAGVGGKGLVFYQTKFEKSWANHVKMKTKCTIKSRPTKGTLRTTASSRGINSITVEVDKKYNPARTIKTEFELLKYSLEYLMVITV